MNLCAKDAMEMADPANSKIIYKNNRLLNEKAEGFRLMHFYAYHVEPIQEVRKSTVRTAVDKEAERRAYQRKLDIQELQENKYSVNIPMRYYYKGKFRRGWVNIVNPFRGTCGCNPQ